MKVKSKDWFGIFLIAIGILWIADNFLFFDFNLRELLFSWDTIFIIIGLVLLSNSRNSTVGIIFIVIGAFGMLNSFAPFNLHFRFRDYWPILLIIIGFLILSRKKSVPISVHTKEETKDQSGNQESYYGDTIDESMVFNSTNRLITSENFKGGRISAVFGSVKINLYNAKLAAGENSLDLTCVFGGCEIIVPKNWKVIVNVTSIFGGFDDKRYLTPDSNYTEGVLIIQGTVLFGGGEILTY
jgi:predicted membrane protein